MNKEILDSNNLINDINCFELATLLSGKWVNTIFKNSKSNNSNIFEMKIHSNFNFLIKDTINIFIDKLQYFLNKTDKDVKYSCIEHAFKVRYY